MTGPMNAKTTPVRERPLRICYFGTYRADYVRNRLMIDRLRAQGVQVIECHARLWRGIEDREQVGGGGWKSPRFWWRAITAYARLLWRYLRVGSYDVMLVGYPGQPDIPLARLLTWMSGKPLVWDVLMSIYLIARERKLEARSRFSVEMMRRLESLDCRLVDWFLLDTPAYADWFQETYAIPKQRIRLLPLGADDRVFKPATQQARPENAFGCVYYGTFIPNHSVETIIRAADLLRSDPEIQFELIGQGPEKAKARQLAHELGLENVRFVDWMDVESLIAEVGQSELCLGTFGKTPQALMTMQNKIHECLAMAKPLINGDSPVMRALFQHGEQIYLCPREDPQALAQAIRALKGNPALREKLARQGYAYYQEHLSFERLGQQLAGYLEEIVA
jgi:glycosyltransferase involved in cell wall biosynthesis